MAHVTNVIFAKNKCVPFFLNTTETILESENSLK